MPGKNVRYALLIENGCASSDPARPCPPPVTGLTVTLNEDVVFQNDDAFTKARSEITLNPAGTQLNSLVLAAKGAPGSAARIRIIAIRQPVDKSSARFAGLSEKPSNGLEPLTPSLPFWNQAGTRGHQRVTAVATVPQVGGI